MNSNDFYPDGICLISFSHNSDHQELLYSMFDSLEGRMPVYSIGVSDVKIPGHQRKANQFYFDCPLRPGIQADTFKLHIIFEIVKTIRRLNVRYVYFESLHVWNIAIMLLLKNHICIEAVHDVIPHDNSYMVKLCTKITCMLAHKVVIHNGKYMDDLSKMYKVKPENIRCINLWKRFPEEQRTNHSGQLLYFGRIRKYKGLDLLEQVVLSTSEISYVIAGEPDEESVHIVERLKSCKNVTMIDRAIDMSEMEVLFREADWVLLPYISATQSGVIVDAYRYSRPVIAFDVGAISEQVVPNVSGILVEANDIDAFTQAIVWASELSLESLEQFSHNAYIVGKQKYAVESVAESFVSAIRE